MNGQSVEKGWQGWRIAGARDQREQRTGGGMIPMRESLAVQSGELARLHQAGKRPGVIFRSSVRTRPGLWVGVVALAVLGVAWAITKLMFAAGGATILALLHDAGHVAGGGLPGAGGAGAAGGANPNAPSGVRFVNQTVSKGIIHSGPDPGSPVISTPTSGALLHTSGTTGDGQWTQVRTTTGKVGYISTSSIDDHRPGELPYDQARKLFDMPGHEVSDGGVEGGARG